MLDLGNTETEMRSGVTPGISGVTLQKFRRYPVTNSALRRGNFGVTPG